MVATVGLAAVGPMGTPEAEAATDGYYIQPVYYVPQGAPRNDRAWVIQDAVEALQAEWANFGLTFRVAPVRTVYPAQSCAEHGPGNDGLGHIYRAVGAGSNWNVKFAVIGECAELNGGGGVNTDNVAVCFLMDQMEREVNEGPYGHGGGPACLGHELGHAFTLPHENCGGNDPNNVPGLEQAGFPTYATASVMCNNTPLGTIEDPTASWIRDQMLRGRYYNDPERPQGCEWFFECSGGTTVPTLANTGLTNREAPIVNGNGKCLDVPSGSREAFAEMQVWDCVGGEPNQLFRAIPARDNVRFQFQSGLQFNNDGYNIRSLRSGMCVDIAYASRDAGAGSIQHPCSYDHNQAFYFDSGTIKVKHTGMCLTASGAGNGNKVVQQPCNGSLEQTWSTDAFAPEPELSIPLRFEHSNKCVDIDGASQASGANAQQWDCVAVPQQSFDLVPQRSGSEFTLRISHSYKCLDVAGGRADNGTNVQQWDCNGSSAQQFRWENSSLVSVASGKCLEVGGGSDANGANIQLWDCADVPQQRIVDAPGDGGNPPPPGGNCRYTVTNDSTERISIVEHYGRGIIPEDNFIDPGQTLTYQIQSNEFTPNQNWLEVYTGGGWNSGGEYADQFVGPCGTAFTYGDAPPPPPPPDPDPVSGSIAGTVTDTAGDTVTGLAIDLFTSNQDGDRIEFLTSTTTATNGTYTLDVDPGCYVVTFIAPDGRTFTNSQGWLNTAVCAEADETISDIDATLTTSDGVSRIGDTVTDTTGAGVAGVAIDLFTANADGTRGSYLRSTTSASDGNYGFEVDPGCHIVTFIAPAGRTFTNTSNWLNRYVCVDTGESDTSADAVLTIDGDTATIAGTVTQNSRGVTGVTIDLFTTTADGQRGTWITNTTTGNDGTYQLDRPAGCYTLTFIAPDNQTFTNGQTWLNRAFCVEAGGTSTGNDAALN